MHKRKRKYDTIGGYTVVYYEYQSPHSLPTRSKFVVWGWGIRLLASGMGWDLGLGIRFQGTGVAGSGIWCRA